MAKTVKFGLKNVHIHPITADSGTALTYGAAIPVTGAVDLSMTPRNTEVNFEADDTESYYSSSKILGYDGTLEVAALPEGVYTSILGQTQGEDKVVSEKDTDAYVRFALTGERSVVVDGTKSTECVAFPYCLPKALPYGTKTSAAGEPQTVTLSIKVDPAPYTRKVKDFTGAAAAAAILSAWHGASAAWMS